jgi:hypothetical protein
LVASKYLNLLGNKAVTFLFFYGLFWSQKHRLYMGGLVAFKYRNSLGKMAVHFLVNFGHKNIGSV